MVLEVGVVLMALVGLWGGWRWVALRA